MDNAITTGLAAFVLLTLWCHGPLSPLLPAAYEPVLLAYGQLLPPVLLAAIGGLAATAVEYLNYHLYRRLLHVHSIERLLRGRSTRRMVTLFSRQPFLTVWICVWSPLPDWGARVLAAHSGYPVFRYLLAVLLARLPRFWFLAAIGLHLQLSPGAAIAIVGGSVALALITVLRRRARSTSRMTAVLPNPPLPEAVMRALPLVLVLVTALTTARHLQAQEPALGTFDRAAKGVSVDRFTFYGAGATAVTFRLSALRPNAVGTELGASLFPEALLAGGLILAPDLGAAYNLRLGSATLLVKAGGSAFMGLGGGFGFYPGVHAGAGLILPVEDRAGFRLDIIRHYYQVENSTVPIWSVGVGITALPRISRR
jgi:membrane protein YqaA with SNARE-associated domain